MHSSGSTKSHHPRGRNPRTRSPPLGIGGVASYLGLRRSYERGWEGPLRAREALRQGLTNYGNELVRVELLAEKARGVIEDALITPIEPTRGMQAMRVLALAREPMTSTEVGRALIDEGQALSKTLVNDIRREFGTSTMARKTTEHRRVRSSYHSIVRGLRFLARQRSRNSSLGDQGSWARLCGSFGVVPCSSFDGGRRRRLVRRSQPKHLCGRSGPTGFVAPFPKFLEYLLATKTAGQGTDS